MKLMVPKACAVKCFALMMAFPCLAAQAAPAEYSCRLGQEMEMTVRLAAPGVKPLSGKPSMPADVHLVSERPVGSEFEYRFLVIPRQAGEFDLKECLRFPGTTKDGVGPGSMKFRVESQLPSDDAGILQWPVPGGYEFRGGYRSIALTIGILWLLSFVWLVLRPLRRDCAAPEPAPLPAPPPMEERLKWLGEKVLAGSATLEDRVALEHVVLSLWAGQAVADAGLQHGRELILREARHRDRMKQLDQWLYNSASLSAAELRSLIFGEAGHAIGPAGEGR